MLENNTTASSKSWKFYFYDENDKCVKTCLYLGQENNVLLDGM